MSIVSNIRTAVSSALGRFTPITPSGTALQNQLRAVEALRRTRLGLAAKVGETGKDIDAAANAKANADKLRSEIDLALADARYAGTPEPDLAEKQLALGDADRLAAGWYAIRARAAETARARYLADIEVINTRLAVLDAATDQYLFNALRDEVLPPLAAEWHRALDTFLRVNREVFTVAVAADRISVAKAFGQFLGAGLWHEVNVPAPNHPAFQRGPTDPWEAQQARVRDAHSLQREADELVRRMLTAEASTP